MSVLVTAVQFSPKHDNINTATEIQVEKSHIKSSSLKERQIIIQIFEQSLYPKWLIIILQMALIKMSFLCLKVLSESARPDINMSFILIYTRVVIMCANLHVLNTDFPHKTVCDKHHVP